jgi:hypothetical protein
MWIEIVGGPKPLWLNEDDCLDKDGDSCSNIMRFPPDTELAQPPTWFKAPEGSQLRHSINWMTHMECRSMRSPMGEILAFYRDVVTRAGLTVSDTLKSTGSMGCTAHLGRRGPGFYAVSDDYSFGIEILEHAGVSFWTIQHRAKVPQPEQPIALPKLPAYRNDVETLRIPMEDEPGAYRIEHSDYKLNFVSMTQERIELVHKASGEEHWASSHALLDAKPAIPNRERPKSLRINWPSLPEWVQFDLDPSSQGSISPYQDEDGTEIWGADTSTLFDGCWRCLFHFCLDWLDNQGFDGTGVERPEHSYYLTILQGGASLNLKFRHERGDSGSLTCLNTLGHMNLRISYEPVRGTTKPPEAIRDSSLLQTAVLRHSFKHY